MTKKIARLEKDGKKHLIVLIDPDKNKQEDIIRYTEACMKAKVEMIFVGGSILNQNNIDECIRNIKAKCNIPIVLFPGNSDMVSAEADAILILSLISGKNPEYLIGQHIIAAHKINNSKLDCIPTAYMLIDGGKSTSVSYMSNTSPIPSDKNDIALTIALAGQQLGNQCIYLEAGSGAINHVPLSMIKQVNNTISIPLIVGGGINSIEKAVAICENGADYVVIGSHFENSPNDIEAFSNAIRNL